MISDNLKVGEHVKVELIRSVPRDKCPKCGSDAFPVETGEALECSNPQCRNIFPRVNR
jgi:NADH pyrophosphatase NudC (nudix superfamily)